MRRSACYERHGSIGATDYLQLDTQRLTKAPYNTKDVIRHIALHELGHALGL